jgi:hypothetical protein
LLKPSEISFSAWVKVDTLKPEMAILFARNISAIANYRAYYALTIKYYNGAYRFGVLRQNDYTGYYPGSITIVSPNTWHHVAFAMSTSTMQVYVNGFCESYLHTPTSYTYDPSRQVILGSTNESQFSAFKGCIDNVRFYERVLSPSEMSALYFENPDCEKSTGFLLEKKAQFDFQVYPNPTNGQLNLDNLSVKPFTYKIYDFYGSIICDGEANLLTSKDQIDLSNYANGLYFIRIRGDGEERIIKIVKE